MFIGATAAGAASLTAHPIEPAAHTAAQLAASFARASKAPSPVGQAQADRPVAPATSASTGKAAPAVTTTTTPPAEPPAPPPKADPPPVVTPPAASAPASAAEQVDRVVKLVNDARAGVGCAPLVVDARLTAAALGHTTDMASRGYFNHDTPEGVTWDQRILAAGYPKPGAENIAMGQTSATTVMNAWMDSPGHRDNILNCDLVAIGVAFVPDGNYWTQDFGL